MNIIDSHVHLTGEVSSGDGQTRADPVDKLVGTMDSLDIAKVCLQGLQGGDNQLVLEAKRKHPSRIIPFIYMDPTADALDLKGLDAVQGIGEIYIRPGSSEIPTNHVAELMNVAKKHDWPILFHTGEFSYTAPMIFKEVIESHPNLTFIFGHMGSLAFVQDAIHMAAKSRNLYLETSGMTSKDMLEKAVRKCGADKLLYGSDYPFWDPEPHIELIKSLDITRGQREKIFGGNVKRIISEETN